MVKRFLIMQIIKSGYDMKHFFEKVRISDKKILLLDYDGTLAPFTEDRNKAFPYDGIREILEAIMDSGHTRLVIISGRAIEDLKPLLGLKKFPEIWGSHGWEYLDENGVYTSPTPEEKHLNAFDKAKKIVEIEDLIEKFETKPASVALHWRGFDKAKILELIHTIGIEWEKIASESGLHLHNFDGGFELRIPGRDKGFAVESIIGEVNCDDYVISYLGDDFTDEDAFKALKGKGLNVLVRNELRDTVAEMWLKPPHELINFLNLWNNVTS